MTDLLEQRVLCPYCHEEITILVDDSLPDQEYIEDCQVCCRPIEVSVKFDLNGELTVLVRHENE